MIKIKHRWKKLLINGLGKEILLRREQCFTHDEIQDFLETKGYPKVSKSCFIKMLNYLKKHISNNSSNTSNLQNTPIETNVYAIAELDKNAESSTVIKDITIQKQDDNVMQHELKPIEDDEKAKAVEILTKMYMFPPQYPMKSTMDELKESRIFYDKWYPIARREPLWRRFVYSDDLATNALFELAVLQGKHYPGVLAEKPMLLDKTVIRKDIALNENGIPPDVAKSSSTMMKLLSGEYTYIYYYNNFLDKSIQASDMEYFLPEKQRT